MFTNRNSQSLIIEQGLNTTSFDSVKSLGYNDEPHLNWNAHSSFNPLTSNSYNTADTKPDLVIEDANAPITAAIGSTIDVTYKLSNKGQANAGFTYTDFYLSKDTSLSSDDQLLGWNSIMNSVANSFSSESQNLKIDSEITAGNYYLLYVADSFNDVNESDEGNNIAAREITLINNTAGAGGYNSTSGYGLVNAAAAVGKAKGQNTFPDVPNLGGDNWNADMVKAPEAWAQGYTGQGVVVAVLDTGIDYNHSDLKNNIWTNTKDVPGNGIDDDGNGYIDDVYGWNFADENNYTLDGYGHGTHVAGTIAGENNSYGVTGIAYNTKIMPVKVLGDDGSGSYNAITNGIYYAVNNGANVINLSLGGDYPNSSLESAIEYASSKGVTVVMAAGNEGDSRPSYPARYANKYGIAVGAVDSNNNLASFSDRAGNNPIEYVTAPGVNVHSTVPGDKYATYSGTSMATPHVAGVVALMLSANPSLSTDQIRQILAETSGNSLASTTRSYDSPIAESSVYL
jgi:subtilisin family serine protease